MKLNLSHLNLLVCVVVLILVIVLVAKRREGFLLPGETNPQVVGDGRRYGDGIWREVFTENGNSGCCRWPDPSGNPTDHIDPSLKIYRYNVPNQNICKRQCADFVFNDGSRCDAFEFNGHGKCELYHPDGRPYLAEAQDDGLCSCHVVDTSAPPATNPGVATVVTGQPPKPPSGPGSPPPLPPINNSPPNFEITVEQSANTGLQGSNLDDYVTNSIRSDRELYCPIHPNHPLCK